LLESTQITPERKVHAISRINQNINYVLIRIYWITIMCIQIINRATE